MTPLQAGRELDALPAEVRLVADLVHIEGISPATNLPT
jgi:hypothetical protein